MNPSEELNKGYEFTKAQIAELESLRAENEGLKKRNAGEWVDVAATMAENETLRARLAELEKQKQEPVAVIGNDYQLLYVGSGPLAPLVWKHGLKVGSKLYAAPVVSPNVEKLIADHNSDMAACHEQFMDVSREVMSLKTELEAARKDAESWRSYKKRKDEVIAAGMGRKILRDAAIEQAKGGVE